MEYLSPGWSAAAFFGKVTQLRSVGLPTLEEDIKPVRRCGEKARREVPAFRSPSAPPPQNQGYFCRRFMPF